VAFQKANAATNEAMKAIEEMNAMFQGGEGNRSGTR
jgi:hypothetical protein